MGTLIGLGYFRISDKDSPSITWLSYYLCMRPQQDKWTKTARDSLSCWHTLSLTLGSHSRRPTRPQLTLTNAASVTGCTAHRCVCVCGLPCAEKEPYAWRKSHLSTNKTFRELWRFSKPEPNIMKNNLTVSRLSCSSFVQKGNLLNLFNLKQVSQLLACFVYHFCPDSTSLGATDLLHLLPEIWGPGCPETHGDILFLPAAGSKHTLQAIPTPQISLLLEPLT